jgi:hypothetical protein
MKRSRLKTWTLMYSLIWLSFIQILFVLFSPLGNDVLTIAVHAPLGLVIFGLAFLVNHKVQSSGCPDRIKRITKVTRNLALLQGLLGFVLAAGISMGWADLYLYIVSLLHVANALAIITQASSSATAFDMWEEKEYQVAMAPQAPSA